MGNASELYDDLDYCLHELQTARSIFCNPQLFTADVANEIMKTLALMYVYCPNELKIAVLADLNEVEYRMMYIK